MPGREPGHQHVAFHCSRNMKGRSFQGEQYDKRFLTICQVKGSQKKVKRNVARFCQRGPYAASCGAARTDDFPVTAGRLSSSSGAFPRFSGRKDSRSVVGEIRRPSGARGGIRGGIGGCRVPEKLRSGVGENGICFTCHLPVLRHVDRIEQDAARGVDLVVG